jgi:hypothetical protein
LFQIKAPDKFHHRQIGNISEFRTLHSSGLNFEDNKESRENSHFWADTNKRAAAQTSKNSINRAITPPLTIAFYLFSLDFSGNGVKIDGRVVILFLPVFSYKDANCFSSGYDEN